MLSHAEPKIVFKLLQNVPYYVSQTSIPIEHRLEFLFLAEIHRRCVPSIMHSLILNYKASCRDPDKYLKECKYALPPELLAELKWVLHCHNPTKFAGHITEEQHQQVHVYDNPTQGSNKIPKIEHTLNKEERNKHIAALRFWLEQFFPQLYLNPKVLICREGKSYDLLFDGCFLETTFSTCINQFASTSEKIELQHGTAMKRYLIQTCNLGTSSPAKEILLFDDDTSVVFRHIKLHLQAFVARDCSVGEIFCMSIGSVLGAMIILR